MSAGTRDETDCGPTYTPTVDAAGATPDTAKPESRLERRKARTRQALLDAARAMAAEGRSHTATIADITDAADVGFGSFYNHFEDKQALFAAVLDDIVSQLGDWLDAVVLPSEDPAEVFLSSFRQAARAAVSSRQGAEIIDRSGFALLDSPTGLGPRAHRDLTAAVARGRFVIANVEVATAITGGCLLGLVHQWLRDPESVAPTDIDDAAEQLVRSFGLDADEARVLAHLELGDLPPDLPSDLPSDVPTGPTTGA